MAAPTPPHTPPASITEIKGLRSLLSNKIPDGYEIVDHTTRNLTAIGDNYGSTMLALTVNLRHVATKKIFNWELVAKMAPSNPAFFQMFQVPLSFPKESSMYTSVAEAIRQHQVQHQVAPEKRLNTFCKCLGTRKNLNGSDVVDMDAVLVLENLKGQGFGCGSRTKGFNKCEAEFVLKHLARFHAVPISIRRLKPDLFEREIAPSLIKINMQDAFPPKMMEELVQVSEVYFGN